MCAPDTPDRAPNRIRRVATVIALASWAAVAVAHPANSGHGADDCPRHAMHDHVRERFAEFGPRSIGREYFGFIYLADGKVASTVVSGKHCRGSTRCIVDTTHAARAIPKYARLLGEWHTHPMRSGSRALSADDVRGARRHRHIRCYQAYYSTPDGDIYAWDVRQTSVPTAMATRVHLGTVSAPMVPDHRWRLAHAPAVKRQHRADADRAVTIARAG